MIHDTWTILDPPGDLPALPISHPALRAIVARRGIASESDYRRFITPSLEDLHDPAGIHGMDHACERIARAVRDREAILIYGDYDVDGVTSIVLLQTVLRAIGADAGFVVPHRLVDGYGLKMEVIERVLVERDIKLVITVDCGITSIDPVRRAIDRGIDVIITDHHLPPGALPAAAAVLNPKQPGCDYPFKELAGVGVAFKLCCELLRRHSRRISIESLLKIAAIGTIADVAPLVGENRTIAWLGLNALADPRNRGLRALLRRLNLLGRPLRAADVGFKIGPRINAAGRLASADTAIALFAAASDEAAWSLCADLDRMNAERQQIELSVREEAEKQVSESPAGAGAARILILAGEQWHKGVLGLTAGRIAQKFHRPTLVMSVDGDRCVGSGRSIPTINLHAALDAVSDLFTHFGGHEHACGFAFPAANLPALRRRLQSAFAAMDPDLFHRRATVDAQVGLGEIDAEFVRGHELLQPFGSGNPQPLFAVLGAEVKSRREFAEECREFVLGEGEHRASAVLWPSVRELTAELAADRVDVLVQLEPDGWAPAGARLSIIDARMSSRAGARDLGVGRHEAAELGHPSPQIPRSRSG